MKSVSHICAGLYVNKFYFVNGNVKRNVLLGLKILLNVKVVTLTLNIFCNNKYLLIQNILMMIVIILKNFYNKIK